MATFSDILDKVQGKIENWHSKTLSQVGKTVLVKVVASAILSSVMSTFLLPDGLCHQLDRAFKKKLVGISKGQISKSLPQILEVSVFA
jgi:predicted PurR-regulated permease PerM